MKNENSTDRRDRMQAERTEEDKRIADAAATEAARTRLATEAARTRQATEAEAAEKSVDPPLAHRQAADEAQAERQARADAALKLLDEAQANAEPEKADRDGRDRQHEAQVGVPFTFRSPLQDASERHPVQALKFWELHAKNRDAPPFHFTNVAHCIRVVAGSAEDARHVAAGIAGEYGVAWLDDTQTDCAEMKPTKRGLISQDLGV